MDHDHNGPLLQIDTNPTGIKFNIRVQPRASRNQVVGLHNGALKVKVQAPPVEGAANKACIAVMAKALQIPKSSIEIISGHNARNKRLRVGTGGKGAAVQEINQIQKILRSLC